MLAVLQPREEGNPSGAVDIISSGLLQANQVGAMAAAHVQPLLQAGEVACAPGVVNASADEFFVTMTGRPGHAAYPHLTRDPVLAMAQFVVAVQQLVSRNTDPMQPAVVTVGTLAAGEASNAIPGTATARGTMRAVSAAHRDLLDERLREVAGGVALAHGCTADVRIDRGEADDFAFYGGVTPSLMLFVGTGGQPGSGLHTATFLPSDRAVADVADALLAGYLAGCAAIAG
jgi:amidohydrolase